jgi:hypothetical protein
MLMRGKDNFGEPRDDGKIELALLGKMVERLRLVEAAQMNRPFDNVTVRSTKRQPARTAPDRHCAEIEVRRIGFVDGDLVLAGGAALFQRRKIHERKEDRPLYLVGVGAGEKNDGAMRVDPRNRSLKSIGRGIGEKGEDLALIFRRVHAALHGAAEPQRQPPDAKRAVQKSHRPSQSSNYSAAASFCVVFLASSAR